MSVVQETLPFAPTSLTMPPPVPRPPVPPRRPPSPRSPPAPPVGWLRTSPLWATAIVTRDRTPAPVPTPPLPPLPPLPPSPPRPPVARLPSTVRWSTARVGWIVGGWLAEPELRAPPAPGAPTTPVAPAPPVPPEPPVA